MTMATAPDTMLLTVLLPFQVYAEYRDVQRLVVETAAGACGVLPQRRDCVAPLRPGILTYRRAGGRDAYIALDQGMLIKTGAQVVVSVRRAVAGDDLAELRSAVEREFLQLDEHERELRRALAKLEAGVLRRLAELRRG